MNDYLNLKVFTKYFFAQETLQVGHRAYQEIFFDVLINKLFIKKHWFRFAFIWNIACTSWNEIKKTYYNWLSKAATVLAPVCCQKHQKVPDQLLVCGIGDLWRTWMIPNWLYTSPECLDHPGSILYPSQSSEVPYCKDQKLVRNFFFAVSYSKPTVQLSLRLKKLP